MAKIPVKVLKIVAPVVWDFTKKHGKEIAGLSSTIIDAQKGVKDYNKNKKQEKESLGKIHYRKSRYQQFNREVLKDLENMNRSELFRYKLEIEQYLNQIEIEKNNEFIIKKPLHSKRIGNWYNVLLQVRDWIELKDYQEYLFIFHNPNFQSKYFLGFEGLEEKFKIIISTNSNEKIHEFLDQNTTKNIEDIKKDFS